MSIFSGVGSSPSVGPTSGGKVYAFNNIGTSPQVVAPANTSRTQITFYNPGPVTIYIAPVNVQALNSIPASITNQALTPTLSALGGCFIIGGGGGYIPLTGECQGAWQAFAISGTTNALTVVDTNA